MNNSELSSTIISKRKKFINPAFVLCFAWMSIAFLYLLSLSERLYYRADEVLMVSLGCLFPAILGYFVALIWGLLICKKKRLMVVDFNGKCFRKIKITFYILFSLSLIEFLYERYIPILSKIKGLDVSHFDFGLPSIHGFIMAGFLSLSTISMFLYMKTKKRFYLYIIVYTIIWAILVVSRKIFMVGITQWILIYLTLNKINLYKVTKLLFFILLFIALFGLVGDIRSGSTIINELGGFADDNILMYFPGLNWLYLYLTTPLHNLIYVVDNTLPEYNYFYFNTFKTIIPNVFSAVKLNNYEGLSDYAGVWFESQAFNVSTLFLKPFIDIGWIGIFFISFVIGFVSTLILYFGKSSLAFFSLITMSTACILAIYSDNFTNLNFIGQFIFYFYIFLSFRIKSKLG